MKSPIPEAVWLEAEAIYPTGGTAAALATIGRHDYTVSRHAIHEHMASRGIRRLDAVYNGPAVTPDPDDATVAAEVAHERTVEGLKRENRILKRKYEEAVRAASLEDVVTGLIRDYREMMPTPKVRLDNRENTRKAEIDETICLLLTDLHVGETVDGDAMHGINRYDVGVFLARMERLYDRIVSICFGALKGYKFEELRIYCLGDLVNGMFGAMHDELIVTQASDLMETVYGTALVLVQFIARLLQYFERITVLAAPGNHGRMTRKPWAKGASMNWDMIVPQIASTKFSGSDRVTFRIPDSFFFVDEIRGQRILGLHGHQVKGWASIPWYGINRTVGNLTEVLSNEGMPIDHVVMGHFHTEAIFDRVGGEVIAGPCLKGADEYTLSAGFKPAPAGQTLFGLHGTHGVTHRWRIDVQDAYEPKGEFNWWPGGTLGDAWKATA